MMDKPADMASADHAAMARLAAGDDHALDEIMARWAMPLQSFLYRFTQNHGTAEDLAQETFVRLYQSRDRYRPSGAFSTYLFQIASNLARNHARWKARHPEESLDEPDCETHAASGSLPWENVAGLEVAADIKAALAALPEDLRLPLVLAVYENQSRNEIAAVLGCTPKAAEMRLYRARQLLRDMLAKHLGPA